MGSTYSYSFDGNAYRGSFPSRKEARQAGFAAARELSEPPGMIFVGRTRPVDPQAAHHARHVLQEMNRRFRDITGDTRYLMDISESQRLDLDQQLEQAIRAWLVANDLLPQGQRVESISEYPLPIPTAIGALA